MLGRAFMGQFADRCVALSRSQPDFSCEWVQGDLNDLLSVEDVIKRTLPSVCFHFAACTDLALCERDPLLADKINWHGAAGVARSCSEIGAKVVFMCTDSVFDGRRGNYAETDTPNPLNHYARSKLLGEQATLAAADTNISIRGNIIGRQGTEHGSPKLYDWALKGLKDRATITGFSDVVFNPLSVASLSSIVATIAERGLPGGIWHVGSLQAVSKEEFIRLVAHANRLGEENVLSGKQKDLDLYPPRPLNTSLKTGKIRRAGIEMPGIESEIELIARDQ
jgi:dTDP-4-dehydrorhamnose reductase